MSGSGAQASLTVLWVVSTFPTPANPTRGVFIEEQAAQVGRRCRLHILALLPWYPPLPRYQDARTLLSTLPVSADYPTFTVHYLRVPYVARWWLPLNLVRAASLALATLWSVAWLWRWSERPALIHAHMGTNAPTGAAMAWLARAPLVTTVHGSDVNYGMARGTANWFRRWATILGLKASRVVVGVSEALRRRVIELGLPESRVVHIPNGFDETRFRTMETSEARGKLGLSSSAKIVVCVSGLVPVKGVDVLLEAFSRLHHGSDGPILYCVGDGPERSKLESRVKAAGLNRRVHFVGARPHEEIPLWMNAADVFAMASRDEGWPTVLSEALACGKRVVATAVGGVPEILRDEYLGTLVPPEEPEALAEAIRHALDSPADRDRIASYAQRFTWSSVGSRVMDAYDQVLGEGSSARETSQP